VKFKVGWEVEGEGEVGVEGEILMARRLR